MKLALRTPVVFDGRNLYEPSVMAAFGLEYHCIGRASTLSDRRWVGLVNRAYAKPTARQLITR